MKTIPEINFTKITEQHQDEAKNVILEGFKERFGFIDHTLNPDLKNIYTHYTKEGNVFFVAPLNDQIICTGALTKENHSTARIERMSVKKEFRRQGLARKMLLHLERHAGKIGYTNLVMETNKAWESAIQLYKTNGYVAFKQDSERIHMVKHL